MHVISHPHPLLPAILTPASNCPHPVALPTPPRHPAILTPLPYHPHPFVSPPLAPTPALALIPMPVLVLALAHSPTTAPAPTLSPAAASARPPATCARAPSLHALAAHARVRMLPSCIALPACSLLIVMRPVIAPACPSLGVATSPRPGQLTMP